MWSKRLTAFLLCLALAVPTAALAAEETAEQELDTSYIGDGYDVSYGFVKLTLDESETEHRAYVSGYSDGSFRPEKIISRAEGAQMIYSLLSESTSARVHFLDVPRDSWYYDPVGALAAGGVIPALESYMPDEELSRGEFVNMLVSFFPMGYYICPFTDVAEDHPCRDAIARATRYGWISGYEDGSFQPDRGISRAEAVTVINRALNREADRGKIDESVKIPLFSDISAEHWAYYEIAEAAIAHSAEPGLTETWISADTGSSGLEPDSSVMVGSELYYIGDDGQMVTDATVNGLYFGPDGRYTSGDAEIDTAVKEIIDQVTLPGMSREAMLRRVYDHTRDSYSYLRRSYYSTGDTGWELENARIMFQTGRGNCYCYAAVFYYLARQLGYSANTVSGLVGHGGSPHGWVEIVFDDVVYIFDTELEMSYRSKGTYYYDFYMMSYDDVPWPYVK